MSKEFTTTEYATPATIERREAGPSGSTQLLSLNEWVSKNYAPKSAPCANTVRRWVRDGRIQPVPSKQGRAYFFHPDARYVGA